MLTAPEGLDIWDQNDPDMTAVLKNAQSIVQNIRRDHLEGLVLPFGWKLELLSSGGDRQFDTNKTIDRYDTRIAMTVMADFVLLGHQQTGSFALSDNKTHIFSMAIEAFLDVICEQFNNKAIPDLMKMNGEHFTGLTDYPHLTHGDVEDVDLDKLGNYLKNVTTSGLLVPDEGVEDYIRAAAGLPKRLDDYVPMPGEDREPGKVRTAQKPKKDTGDKMGGLDDEEPEEDPAEVEKARKDLGRD